MKLIVGIGNPGKEYENTRHNVGFNILDNYDSSLKWHKDKDAQIAEITINGEKALFIKPLTYVNLSGNAVARIANFYKVDAKDILVIHDDLDLPSLTFRLKYNSSSGGHNGIKSIINCLGTQEFAQLKVGISNNKLGDTRDYVLSKLSQKELDYLKEDIFKDIINCFVTENIDIAMNRYNGV